jgi:hypothetical protein
MSRKRMALYLLITGAIIHHLLSTEYGPFDRFLEIGVLLLIAYEVVVGFLAHRKTKKRARLLNARRKAISALLEKGNALRHETPTNEEAAAERVYPSAWMTAVNAWGDKVRTFLSQSSPSAANTFSLIRDSNASDNIVHLPNSHHDRFHVSGHLREHYQQLVAQLASLTEIMEKADVYF